MVLPFTSYGPTEFCTTWDEIEDVFGQRGVELHLDHLDAGRETEFKDTLIHRATRHIASYLGARWKLSDLANDIRVREIATYWAAHRITSLRGNPAIFESEYLEGLEELERIREGTLFLDIPTTPRASIQSGVVDLRTSNYRLQPTFLGSSYVYKNQHALPIYYWPFSWL